MPESWFEKMERYLHRNMTAEEKAEFEAELLVNNELAFDFEIYKMIEEEMRHFEKNRKGEEALKASLKEISASFIGRAEETEKSFYAEKDKDISQLKAVPPVSKNKYRKLGRLIVLQRFAVAAAIIGAIALGITWYFVNNKENLIAINKHDSINFPQNKPRENLAKERDKVKQDQELNNKKQEILYADTKRNTLYASNFKRDKTPAIKDEFLADAYSYYDNREYNKAIKAFNNADLTIVSRGSETDTILRKFYAHYYKAQSYMVINNFKKAIVELTDALNESPDSSLQIRTQWYLALAYLKTEDIGKTEKLLKHIAANTQESEYKSKAKKLIYELEK